jgi:hypothetical protein
MQDSAKHFILQQQYPTLSLCGLWIHAEADSSGEAHQLERMSGFGSHDGRNVLHPVGLRATAMLPRTGARTDGVMVEKAIVRFAVERVLLLNGLIRWEVRLLDLKREVVVVPRCGDRPAL